MRNLLTLLFLCLSFAANAQIDTNYIQKIPVQRMLAPHITLNRFQLSLQAPNTQAVHFENYGLRLGLRFKYKIIRFGFSRAIASYDRNNLEQPVSRGFGIGIFPKSLFLQFDLRNHRGLNNLNLLDSAPEQAFRKDIKAVFLNLYGVYAFQSDRLSLRSAFNMIDRQKRSAGSWVMSGNTNLLTIQADSLPLPAFISVGESAIKHQTFSFGAGGGYAYTYVMGNWSATAMLTGGVEFRFMNYPEEVRDVAPQRYLGSPRLRAFGSVLYNGDQLFYGLTGNYIPSVRNQDILNTRLSNIYVRFTVGWRFNWGFVLFLLSK